MNRGKARVEDDHTRFGASESRLNTGDIYEGPISDSIVGGRHTFTANIDSVFSMLERHITKDAFYNSRKREEERASTCHPDTHTRVLGNINGWVRSAESAVCWLRGPAGTGKTTIAQTIAKQCHEDGELAASFFFSRGKGDRDDVNKLVPTLAYQIAEHVPSTESQIRQVLQQNRTILYRTLGEQFSKLIIEPLSNIKQPNRSLIIIDGLDECAAMDGIVQLIKSLGQTFATDPRPPLRFLLTSRPETEIRAAFQSHLPGSTVHQLALEDSVDDVQKLLQAGLIDIRRKYNSVMKDEPIPWPSESDLEALVTKSQGLFIYASTLLQYLNDGRKAPQYRLRQVLKVHDGVDPLYKQVIGEARQSEDFEQVMGTIMYLRYPLTVAELADLLDLAVPNIRMALDRCHSILVVPEADADEPIRPYHASLQDMLTSQRRSGDFYCAPAQFHARIAIRCMKGITEGLPKTEKPPEYAFVAWYHHCSALISEANTSQDFRRLCYHVYEETKKIDWDWLKYWMVNALAFAGKPYIIVDLPSSRAICTEAEELQRELKKISKVLDDFMKFHDDLYRGDLYYYRRVRYYGYDVARNTTDLNKFLSSFHSWKSTYGWRFQSFVNQLTKRSLPKH